MSIAQAMHIVLPSHVNGDNRLFGGQLMSWIDVVGAIAARRHSHSLVTTLFVDNLHFLAPAFINDIIILESKVTWTGNTSMEVLTKTFVEKSDQEKVLVNKAYSVFVAIDKFGNSTKVPKFIPKTEEEISEYNAAIIRKQVRETNFR